MVCEDTINFFGHCVIKRSETGFDMGNQRPCSKPVVGNLCCDQGTGHGRVDVSDHQQNIWSLLQEDWFEPLHYFCGLDSMGSGSNSKVKVGPRQIEIQEKGVRHQFVVVLACVHENRMNGIGCGTREVLAATCG